MTPPSDPNHPRTPRSPRNGIPSRDNRAVEQTLQDVEESLQELAELYRLVQHDQPQQQQLQHRLNQIKQAAEQAQLLELKPDLDQLQTEIDALADRLGNHLITWFSQDGSLSLLSDLKEPFWQLVRFGGVGLIVGWVLAFAVMQVPRPEPPSPNARPEVQSTQ